MAEDERRQRLPWLWAAAAVFVVVALHVGWPQTLWWKITRGTDSAAEPMTWRVFWTGDLTSFAYILDKSEGDRLAERISDLVTTTISSGSWRSDRPAGRGRIIHRGGVHFVLNTWSSQDEVATLMLRLRENHYPLKPIDALLVTCLPHVSLELLLGLAFAGLTVPITARRRRRRLRREAGRCRHCGYALRGGGGRCPECGQLNVA